MPSPAQQIYMEGGLAVSPKRIHWSLIRTQVKSSDQVLSLQIGQPPFCSETETSWIWELQEVASLMKPILES